MTDLIVNANNLRKEFGKARAKVIAIDDVSLKVKKGEVVFIFGPSGSGKTTLLSMLGCILTPTSGEIIINGSNITNVKDEELVEFRRDHIGFIFQSFNLLDFLTAQENVEVALNLSGIKGREAKEKSKNILIQMGLEERLDFYPYNLSGGERQRISIARALVNEPKIVLADEPTGNLDSQTGHKIAELLQKIAKEKNVAMAIVTHDNRIVDIADRILYLEDGLIKKEKVGV
ncbi:MAG: ATP-binding cassette domain-containing protein [Candidatus Heimdallarchaeota archaeon]|nr:ATP-binding cassette domain-containing protein [Candidatus Heimdallarchaeota archaeon]